MSVLLSAHAFFVTPKTTSVLKRITGREKVKS